MTLKNRIVKLETAAGIGGVSKYLCVIHPDHIAEGYKIQPFTTEAGGPGGEPFTLATWEEVEAFEARPDVDLTIIKICYASENGEKQNEHSS